MSDKDGAKRGVFDFLISYRALSLLLLVLLIVIILSTVLPDTFGTFENYSLILLNMSAEIMILIAICLVLFQGDIDLSLGAIMVLGAIICGRLMIKSDMNIYGAISISLLVCLFCGFLNGIITAYLRVTSFIATLATGKIFLGVATMLAGTGWTDFPDPVFKMLGQNKVLGLQLPVYYMVVFLAVFSFLVANTRYFRQYFFIGNNAKAAAMSGINVRKVKVVSFVIAAGLASMGGIISAMRFNTAIPSIGTGVELRAVTAAVIGGVSFTGGVGSVTGAAMGALFIAVLNNALTSLKVSPDLQNCVAGIILIGAIVLDVAVKKRKK